MSIGPTPAAHHQYYPSTSRALPAGHTCSTAQHLRPDHRCPACGRRCTPQLARPAGHAPSLPRPPLTSGHIAYLCFSYRCRRAPHDGATPPTRTRGLHIPISTSFTPASHHRSSSSLLAPPNLPSPSLCCPSITRRSSFPSSTFLFRLNRCGPLCCSSSSCPFSLSSSLTLPPWPPQLSSSTPQCPRHGGPWRPHHSSSRTPSSSPCLSRTSTSSTSACRSCPTPPTPRTASG